MAAVELARDVQVERVISYAKSSQESEALAQTTNAVADAFGGDAHAAHDLAGAYAVAAAVADGSVVNLRRGPLAYTAANERLYKKLRLTAVLAAAVVLLVLAESGVRFYLAKRDLSSLDLSIRSIYKEVFPNRKKPVDEVSELRSEIKRLEGAKMSSNVLKVLKERRGGEGGRRRRHLRDRDRRPRGEAEGGGQELPGRQRFPGQGRKIVRRR